MEAKAGRDFMKLVRLARGKLGGVPRRSFKSEAE
jgi:hypothetical protein